MMSVLVYQYGLLEPTEGAEGAGEQMHLAHRYYNTLIEIERSRREAVVAVMGAHADVAPLQAEVDALAARLDAARQGMPRQNKRPSGNEARQALRAVLGELREKRRQLRETKRALREDRAIREALAETNRESHARAIEARAASGLYWGTYLQIEQAADAARKSVTPPSFHAWRGDGAIAVQLQGGLSVEDLLACEDGRLRFDARPQPVPDRRGRSRSGKPRPRIKVRIGSQEGRSPIWAEWPVIYHRPLPGDARIKWAKVVRRYVGGDEQWSLHLTIETERACEERCGAGAVAVDLGWRRLGSGRVLAGEWCGDQDDSGQFVIGEGIEGRIAESERLRSIRGNRLNVLRGRLVRERDRRAWPEEHAERLRDCGLWKSPRRFATLAHWWRSRRVPGDWRLAGLLAAWLRRENHLWRWEAHTRQRAVLRRRDEFRVLAARLARRYGTLVLERLDLRSVARTPQPESEKEKTRGQHQRVIAAPSELRACLEQGFRARGGNVVTVPAGLESVAGMLAAYREQSSVEEKPVIARPSRFTQLREKARRATV